MTLKYENNPRYKINLAKLSSYTDICQILKEYNVKYYVYAFVCANGIIKYGYSADYAGTWGERVYRQAGHLEGWHTRLNGSSGSDMRIIAENYREKYNKHLNRKDVYVVIIDMTKLNPEDEGNYQECCRELERGLINRCIEQNQQAPIGNKDNVSRMYVGRVKRSVVFNKLFEEVE